MTTPPTPTSGGAELPATDSPASLAALRRHLIDPIMLWIAAPLVITHGFALHRSLDDGAIGWPLLVRLTALGGVFLLLLYRRRIPYRVKAPLFLLCLWVIVGLSVLAVGPVANSKAYFVLMVLVGMLFLSRWAAWLNIAVGGLILGLIGTGAATGGIVFSVDWQHHAYSAPAWVHTVGGFVIYSAIVAWIARRLIDSLSESVTALQVRTEQLQETSRALQTALDRQQAVFNNAAAGIALLDGERRIELANPVFAGMLGYTPEQLQNRSTRLIHLDEGAFQAVRERFYAPLRHRHAHAEDIQLRHADGGTRWTHASLGTLHAGDPARGTVLVLVDIERRKQAEQALAAALDQAEAANRAKSRFLAAVSHELRTPLHAMLGAASVLRGGGPSSLDESSARAALASIQTGGQRLLGMIEDLIDIARLESQAELKLRPEPVALRDLLRECEAAVAPLARIKSLGLSLAIDETLPHCIQADRRRLAQILPNLLGNAVKYTDSGEIRLRAWAERPAAAESGPDVTGAPGRGGRIGLRISVRDTGPSIPEAQQQRLFLAFQQGEQDGDARGSGLGLAIAQGLARRMGGGIRLHSHPREGSTFTLHLPDVAVCDPGPAREPVDGHAGAPDGSPATQTELPPPPVVTPVLAARLRAVLDAPGRDQDHPTAGALAAAIERVAALAHASGHQQLADWSARAAALLGRDRDLGTRELLRRSLTTLAPEPPPLEDLLALRGAALEGRVSDLEHWCERQRAMPRHSGFTARVEGLAAAFEHRRIVALADAYLDAMRRKPTHDGGVAHAPE